jgi:hypothetical protein
VEAPETIESPFSSFLPDDRHPLLRTRSARERRVYVGSLDEPQMKRLLDSDAGFRYSSGYLFFIRESTLFCTEIRVDRLEQPAIHFQWRNRCPLTRLV